MLGSEAFSYLCPIRWLVLCVIYVYTLTNITIIVTVFKEPVIIYRRGGGGGGGGGGGAGELCCSLQDSPDPPIKYITFE